jgi:hypothetical protein
VEKVIYVNKLIEIPVENKINGVNNNENISKLLKSNNNNVN